MYHTRTKKGRAGNVMGSGRTRGGRRIVVVAAWDPESRRIRPINAWEAE
ncbi:hypothetical protein [Nocardiopsis trehalosi]|nr:hypothetical protein [Nocardiopsis trehalosi]